VFRQVAEYSITTHQRVENNSSKPALLAFLLALKASQIAWFIAALTPRWF
jgi:hypothetical protein